MCAIADYACAISLDFNTSEFWLAYPHWRMVGLLKYYYLLQFSYWLQQMLILIAKIEKPRKDYRELVIHVRPFLSSVRGAPG